MTTDELPFRIALLTVGIIHSAITTYFSRQAQAGASIFRKREEGLPLTFLLAGAYLAYILGVLAYLIDPRWMQWSALPIPAWVRWTAIVPIVAGTILIAWGMRHLGKNFALCVSPKESSSLVTTSLPHEIFILLAVLAD